MKGFTKGKGKGKKFIPTTNKKGSTLKKEDVKYNTNNPIKNMHTSYKKHLDKKKSEKSEKEEQEAKIKENADEFDVSVDVLKKLQEEQGDDVFITDASEDEGADGNATRLELDDSSEWYVFDNYGDMEKEAIEDVKQLFDDIGYDGINGFENYVTMSETDKRIFAGEEADSQIEGMEDEIREEATDEVTNELPDDVDEEKLEAEIEKRIERLTEDKQSEIADDIEEELDDPIQYFIHDHGFYSDAKELIDANIVSVDEDALAKYVVEADGAEHTIARYDGNSYESKDGKYLVRIN